MQCSKRRRFAQDRGRLGAPYHTGAGEPLYMHAANTDQVLTSPGSRDSKSQIHLDQLQPESFSARSKHDQTNHHPSRDKGAGATARV